MHHSIRIVGEEKTHDSQSKMVLYAKAPPLCDRHELTNTSRNIRLYEPIRGKKHTSEQHFSANINYGANCFVNSWMGLYGEISQQNFFSQNEHIYIYMHSAYSGQRKQHTQPVKEVRNINKRTPMTMQYEQCVIEAKTNGLSRKTNWKTRGTQQRRNGAKELANEIENRKQKIKINVELEGSPSNMKHSFYIT